MGMSRTATKAEHSASAESEARNNAPLILYRTPGYLARRFQQVCAAIIAESLAKEGLTQLQWAVMSCLDDFPAIDQRRLAEVLSIVPVNAGQIVDQLEAMGIVERRVKGTDRRARELRLTSKGTKLRQRTLPANRATNALILEPLAPSERKLLIDLLVRVIEGNAAYARPGAGRRKRGLRQRRGDKVHK